MWIMSGITGDNLLNYVDNPGKMDIFKYLTLSWNGESMKHIHISTENTARLLIDLLSEIRYTSEAPLEREQILILWATPSVALSMQNNCPGNYRTYVL
jgi:hypothetical protein